MLYRNQDVFTLLASAKFKELDVDNSNFLEQKELQTIVTWVMTAVGDKLGSDPKVVQQKIMDRLDQNRDGKLDFEEFSVLFREMTARFATIERAKAKFDELDTDKSGFLEAAELDKCVEWALQAYQAPDVTTYKAKMLSKVDWNKDGKLDLLEFTDIFEDMLARLEMKRLVEKKFAELDADKTNFLEGPEIDVLVDWVLLAYIEKPKEERSKFKTSLIAKFDLNKDGKIDLPEFILLWESVLDRMDIVARAKRKFAELDVDKSGFLEKGELEQTAKLWAEALKVETDIDVGSALDVMMANIDTNGDGKINLPEFITLFDAMVSTNGVWG